MEQDITNVEYQTLEEGEFVDSDVKNLSENLIKNNDNNNKDSQTIQINTGLNKKKSSFHELRNSNNFDNHDITKLSQTCSSTQEKIMKLKPASKACCVLCSLIFLSLLLTVVFVILGAILRLYFFLTFTPITVLAFFVLSIISCKLITIEKGDAVIISYYGKYLGTAKEPGTFWLPPCSKIERVSLKSQFYNGNKVKVNERDGNPVMLGVIAIWRIKDTAKVIYDITDYHGFVIKQTESAIRYIGCRYPYEPTKPGEISLRGGQQIINDELREELERRVFMAGIEIEDARITEIEYASEVSQMMLKKLAANSVVSAKEKMVMGALKLIENSLARLERNKVCEFNERERAKFVLNMMNVLCLESNNSAVIKLNQK